jgi:hypothetical protein
MSPFTRYVVTKITVLCNSCPLYHRLVVFAFKVTKLFFAFEVNQEVSMV